MQTSVWVCECWHGSHVQHQSAAVRVVVSSFWVMRVTAVWVASSAMSLAGNGKNSCRTVMGGGGEVLQVDTFTAERYSPHNAQSRLQAAAAAAEGSMLLNDRVCEQQHFSSCRRCCKFHTKYIKILKLSLLSVLFCFRDCGTCLSVCVDVCSAPQHCLDAFLGQQRHQTSSGQGGAGTRFWQICGFRLVQIAAGSHYCWCRPP